ncbi:MAG: glycosyltransferase family 2 protein [Vulcanimicrobiaceae bacterium]
MTSSPAFRATIQLCTYNRAALLERVLDACFEQTAPSDSYEVVLVNDGSSDGTDAVIERAKARATCAFTAITQSNAGLARGRNVGIERARGERIIFIDDDVLPTPTFVQEHLRAHDEHPHNIVRGGAINVESFDDLPPPVWSVKHYSGNFFWTTNVSVPLATIRAIGGFNESFSEYGWEDIDVGLRLRFGGVKATFHPKALAYHYKPRLRGRDVAKSIRQSQAQARTAVQLARIHPHWRTYLATGINPLQRSMHRWFRSSASTAKDERRLSGIDDDSILTNAQVRIARRLSDDAYFRELERSLAAAR